MRISAFGGALLATGAFLPVLAIALNRQLRRLDASSVKNPALVELLGRIPIFAPLPESAIEHLASSLTARAFPAGAVVFSQGERGDRFYIIESGQVDVLTDGISVATLGSSDSFGEIALLRDVPRTATIRTLTDVQLQRLDRARFTGTGTGNSTSADAADAVVGSRLGLRSGFTAV
ncbi:MAG: cyclic nucleotide-binding domain-containing protein [Thermoleophilia bacterium]|nr:cyclic nucleotide-binding domain-containing protein [Thermoleophilia bacterium]